MIIEKMKLKNKGVMSKDELLSRMQSEYEKKMNKEFGEILITAGAGDIDTLVEPIKNILKSI